MSIVFALCGAYAVYCLITNPAGPITYPDSFHYLNMTPRYPLGYPFFLQLTGERAAIVVQPILFGLANALLGREIAHATRNTWLAAAVLLGIVVVPQIRVFHASILSESLFLSLLIIFLALAVRFMYYPSWRLMVGVAFTVGLAATIRRTGFAFVPVMLAMVLIQRPHLKGSQTPLFLVAALAPVAVIAAAEQVMAPIVHAGASSSLMGRHMFAKAALIDAPPAPVAADPVRRALDEQLERQYAPIRDMLGRAPDHLRGVLSIYYETCLQGGCADEARAATRQTVEARQTELMGAAGLARIRRAPFQYLRLTLLHYQSLWTVNRLRHPDTVRDLNAFLAIHRPLPHEVMALALQPDQQWHLSAERAVRFGQYAISAVAILTGALALLACIAAVAAPHIPPAFAAASIAALTAHGGLLLTAFLAAGFTRFLLGLWPALVVACGFGAWALAEGRKEIKNSRSRSKHSEGH